MKSQTHNTFVKLEFPMKAFAKTTDTDVMSKTYVIESSTYRLDN